MFKKLPKPLIGRDGSFTYVSIVKRLPKILEETLKNNNFDEKTSNKILSLIKQISDEKGVIPSDDGIPTFEGWKKYIDYYEKKYQISQKTWLDIPWFYVENYAYARLLSITGYFDPHSKYYKKDPFEKQKTDALTAALKDEKLVIVTTKPLHSKEDFVSLLEMCLWGNQCDLSLSAGKLVMNEHESTLEHILDNHTDDIWDSFQQKKKRVDFIVDNCGIELVSDLFLMHFLLKNGYTDQIVIHLKQSPVFVSDAMVKDVEYTISQLQKHNVDSIKIFGDQLSDYVKNGKIRLRDDEFFSSPLPFWEVDGALKEELTKADIVFVKGDANYRRLVGDLHWDFSTKFEEVVHYFPTDLICLRTLKSEVALGIPKHLIPILNEKEPNWLTDGKHGVIQYFKKH